MCWERKVWGTEAEMMCSYKRLVVYYFSFPWFRKFTRLRPMQRWKKLTGCRRMPAVANSGERNFFFHVKYSKHSFSLFKSFSSPWKRIESTRNFHFILPMHHRQKGERERERERCDAVVGYELRNESQEHASPPSDTCTEEMLVQSLYSFFYLPVSFSSRNRNLKSSMFHFSRSCTSTGTAFMREEARFRRRRRRTFASSTWMNGCRK